MSASNLRRNLPLARTEHLDYSAILRFHRRTVTHSILRQVPP
jgi:hypothetical protein